MSEEILQVRQYGKTNKIIKDLKERNDKLAEQYRLRDIRCVHLELENERLQQKVEQLEKENEQLRTQVNTYEKENNDLRKIYQNTYKKYLENGNEEMAHYFMAQIDACPTFYVEPVIDYYKEYHRLENIRKEAIEYLESYNTDFEHCKFGEAPISIRELGHLLNILNKGSE